MSKGERERQEVQYLVRALTSNRRTRSYFAGSRKPAHLANWQIVHRLEHTAANFDQRVPTIIVEGGDGTWNALDLKFT